MSMENQGEAAAGVTDEQGDGAGAGREWFPPAAIVVIHGVGDHKEDETARELGRALGRTMNLRLRWTQPTYVSYRGAIQSVTRDEPDVPTFSFGAYEVEVPELGAVGRIPIYEFYWSKLSPKGKGFMGELQRSWQFLAGLPRVGYQALVPAVSGWAGGLMRVVRPAFCLAWVLLVLRLIFSLALILALLRAETQTVRVSQLAHDKGLPSVPKDQDYDIALPNTAVRYFDALLPIDLVIALCFLAFSVSLGLVAVADYRAFRTAAAAVLSLTVTAILTTALPYTIINFTKIAGRVEIASFYSSWYSFQGNGERPSWYPDSEPWFGFTPGWFYATNISSGFVPYLAYGVVTVWAAGVMLLGYVVATRNKEFSDWSDAARDDIRRRMAWVRSLTRGFWAALVLLVLVVAPLLLWCDFTLIVIGRKPLPPVYLPGDGSLGEFFIYRIWVPGLVNIFILFIWGLIAWPALRSAVAPALELVFDVVNYFPSVPVLDEYRATRWLLGGRGQPERGNSPALSQRLARRLRQIIWYAHRHPGGGSPGERGADVSGVDRAGPVAVVGHSLGSVIALSALDGWDGTLDGGEAGGRLEVDLVTLGSPLVPLARSFPHLYGTGRPDGGCVVLPTVRSWLNLYRGADIIGRDFDPELIERMLRANPGLAIRLGQENVSNGGHGGYFADDRVATTLIQWLFTAPASSAPGKVGGSASDPLA
jgi:hypothetical protein